MWVLGCAMVAAAVEDALRLRISNVTSLVVLVGAILAAVLHGPSWVLWQNLLAFAIVLTLGTVAFAAGWLGGGDVKLFAATALWFNLKSTVWLVALVFIAGGVVAVCYLLSRPFRRGVRGTKKGGRVPYGIAIAAGALIMGYLVRGGIAHHPLPLVPVNLAPHQG
jgi:prepilin peptidase CpaA